MVPVVVVFNYPRLELFRPPADTGGRRIDPEGREIVLYQGAISEDRGLSTMLEAMALLMERFPELELVLLGPIGSRDLQKANRFIVKNGLEGSVRIRGTVPHLEVAAAIGRAAVGLVPFTDTPSLRSGLAIKQFEYMACGLPIVGADLPLITRYVSGAGAGIVFEPGSAKGLAAAIERVLSDASAWRRMSEAGARWVEEWWNWDQTAIGLTDLYERLVPGLRKKGSGQRESEAEGVPPRPCSLMGIRRPEYGGPTRSVSAAKALVETQGVPGASRTGSASTRGRQAS